MTVFVVVFGNCFVEVLHYFLPESAEVDLKFELISDWVPLAEIGYQRFVAGLLD